MAKQEISWVPSPPHTHTYKKKKQTKKTGQAAKNRVSLKTVNRHILVWPQLSITAKCIQGKHQARKLSSLDMGQFLGMFSLWG